VLVVELSMVVVGSIEVVVVVVELSMVVVGSIEVVVVELSMVVVGSIVVGSSVVGSSVVGSSVVGSSVVGSSVGSSVGLGVVGTTVGSSVGQGVGASPPQPSFGITQPQAPEAIFWHTVSSANVQVLPSQLGRPEWHCMSVLIPAVGQSVPLGVAPDPEQMESESTM